MKGHRNRILAQNQVSTSYQTSRMKDFPGKKLGKSDKKIGEKIATITFSLKTIRISLENESHGEFQGFLRTQSD